MTVAVFKDLVIPVVTLALVEGDIRARPQGDPAGADVGELSRIHCLENSQQFNHFSVWVLCLVQAVWMSHLSCLDSKKNPIKLWVTY